MSYLIEKLASTVGPLVLTTEQKEDLSKYIRTELEEAEAARSNQEALWVECLRLYEALPQSEFRDAPIQGYKNLEVPLIGISTDAIYAQITDLIFSVNPPISIQPTRGENVEGAKALQKITNWGAGAAFNFREAVNHTTLDTCLLGTGFYYCPFVQRVQKTRSTLVKFSAPRIFSLPLEDMFVPGGSPQDIQFLPWISARFWLSQTELNVRARRLGWAGVDQCKPVGNRDFIRSRRELLARTNTSQIALSGLYEIHDVYLHYDIDGDGYEEDLLVTFDRTSGTVLATRFNPYDRRPFVASKYQIRPHLFYGQGIAEMLRALQYEESETHNLRMINMMIANMRIFIGSMGNAHDTVRLWPGRVLQSLNPEQFKEVRIGDVYPSSMQAEAALISLAERRVGLNEMSMPRPSQVLGSRTPGITAVSMLQQANKRFAPVFDEMRLSAGEAIKQCLYRWQERLLAGDRKLVEMFASVLGEEDAIEALELLKDENFDEAFKVELTAGSIQQNRMVDQQNQLALSQILQSYYKMIMELAMVISNPQAPPAMKEVAEKVSKATTELLDRTLRTFDQIRDPETFLVEIDQAMEQAVQGAPPDGLQGLGALFQALGASEGAGQPIQQAA